MWETLVKNKKLQDGRLSNFKFRYIDFVVSTNNSNFSDQVPLKYHQQLENNETTDMSCSTPFKTYTYNLR